MRIFRKLIHSTNIIKFVPQTVCRHFHPKQPPTAKSNKKLIISFTGLVVAAYYYLYLSPKWSNRRVFFENTNSEIPGQEDIQSNTALRNSEKSTKTQFNFIDKVVKKCAPGVFHIVLTSRRSNTEEVMKASHFVYGSGFVIREDGWALTNAHVVLDKDSYISCEMSDGSVYRAQVVDIDFNIDVALLKLDTDKQLTALPLEEPGVVDVGEWVVALGSPLCLSNSISVGVVSSINRSAKELGLKNYSMKYIQTDALITFGNSGGPLVNIDGKVIGINSLRLTSGISFAIPMEFCRKFLANSKTFEPSNPSEWKKRDDEITLFGLTTIQITSDMLIDLMQKKLLTFPKDINEGLLVWKVLEGSIAQECGLAAGDVITHINGVPVKYAADIYKAKSQMETVEFVIIKKSTQQETTLSIPVNKIMN